MQHVDITDTEGIHEPKGCSSATAGQVYVADGSGSGAWTTQTQTEPLGIDTATAGQIYIADGAGSGDWTTPSYANLAVINNVNTFTPVAADITQYKQMTVANGITWSAGPYSVCTLGTNSITLTEAGTYHIDFWGTIISSAADGTQFAVKFYLDATPDSRNLKVQKNSTGSDVIHISASSPVTVTAGQVLTLYMASSATTTLVLENAGLTVHKLK